MKIVLNDVTNIDSLSVINNNFDKIKNEFQEKVLYRNNPLGEPNSVENTIDMNGFDIINVGTIVSDDGTWATVDEVEAIRVEVAANAATVANDKATTLSYKNSAETAANTAATLYDNFDDRYLGVKSSDPSLDNDGNTLLSGALYFRSSGPPIMRVYNGTTWQDVGSITSTTTNTIDPSLYANQTEAEQGTNNTKVMTPLRVKDAVYYYGLPKDGSVSMTGLLTLSGNASTALQAVPLQQAQSIATAAVADRVQILTYPAKTASGTLVEFSPIDSTGIPSWAKRITIMFSELSTTGAVNPIIQLGNSTYKTTGYAGAQALITTGVGTANLSTGFQLGGSGGAAIRNGSFTLNLMGSNTWTCQGLSGSSDSIGIALCAGYVMLTGTLDRIRLYAGGIDSFDSGSVSIIIEG